MDQAKLRYAVMAFVPAWSQAHDAYAFAPDAFEPGGRSAALVLDIDRNRLVALRSFGRERWQAAQAADAAMPVNPAQ